jgi:peptide/nickel transport system substrate-binding protein
MQVEDDVLLRLEKGGKGKTVYSTGGDIEFIALNFTDPNTEIDGERSSMKTKHPQLSDPAVRKALALLVDRDAIQKHIYGRAGRTTASFLNGPDQFVSKNTKWEFSIEKATQLLEEAGWKAGTDGIREKDGRKLKLLYQTAINGPRQKTQAIVKQACQKAGIDIELKSVVASVFFSSDVGNPDTYSKFYADIEMFQIPMTQPDPAQHMRRFHSRFVATKENKWQGRNFPRWVNKEFDAAIDAAEAEVDPVKRAAFYIKSNDIMWQDTVVIPVMHRLKVGAATNSLRPVLSGWTNDTDNIQDWYRET